MQFKRLPGFILALALACGLASAARADEVTVFAAASTTNALTEIGRMFTAKTGNPVRSSFASSSTLAKQVEQGAPANVFVSADTKWMDYLAAHKLVAAGTRADLLGNGLVLIAPLASKLDHVALAKDTDLAALLGGGRLAVGDPDHVPVGIYAKQALQAMGQWKALEPRLARAESVRAGLALVERGEVPLGIVYSTDAAISKQVKVIGTFPDALHDRITYPVALVAGNATPTARAFLAYLSSPDAKAVFARYGFKVN